MLTACSNYFESGQIQNVGMLVDGTIAENAWNEKGYEGLREIEKEFNTDVFYKENIDTETEIINAVDEFVQDGVNLIFGHSSMYGNYFNDLAKYYPDVHFVYFNGGIYRDNVTSLNFNSHAMGFFGGMIAGEMTETSKVGVIASFLWQPEIEGFYEGVKYQNPHATVEIDYIGSWFDTEGALAIYDSMKKKGVDVFYPAGDAFSEQMLKKAEEDGLLAVGYVSDQHEIAPDAVLTSTIQEVDKLYDQVARKFDDGELVGDILTFDFQDEVIALGEFNEKIPKAFERYVDDTIDEYIDTNLLPNEY
ncbi:BMP family ABC transporter substrate-binding protein [Oceanobacillus bengalensis]|uniref:BMP family ABC transporter substrate-binding protein n=2 Tax=Oceanobacillus bengalensis TaxID=1435466 RepID=A0A494Z8F1_9BACI|nr:BMP family ABC transporter substrate-binding protein [Oceanobacillus bengalensis]